MEGKGKGRGVAASDGGIVGLGGVRKRLSVLVLEIGGGVAGFRSIFGGGGDVGGGERGSV